MKLCVDDALVEAAQALGPIIREHAEEAERQRRLAKPVLDALARGGFLRLYGPRSLGGLEIDPITCARVVEVLSGFDSAVGWAMQSANGMTWWCARLPDEGAEEIYADTPDVFMATAFHPLLQAVPVEGGFRLSGRSSFASNGHDARWLALFAQVMDGEQPRLVDGAPEVIGFMLPAGQVEILDTWHVWGMRGTDSNDLAVHDAFVPLRRTYPMAVEFRPGRHYGGPLYRAPVMGPEVAPWAAVGLAIARGAIDEVCALAQRKTPAISSVSLRERASAQAKVGLAEAILQAARLLLYDTLADAWERTLAGHESSLQQKAQLQLASAHAVQAAAQVAELMFGAAGTSAVYAGSRLGRHFRDIQVFRQHTAFAAGRYETVGQVYLGLAPDFPLVTF